MSVLRRFSRYRPRCGEGYFFGLSFEMNLFCVGAGCAVDAGVVDTAEHEHLVIGLVAETACLADLVHFIIYLI